MQALGALIAISALAASALLTPLLLRVTAGSGVLDVPNARSSHGVPTPRAGGVAIVFVTTMGLVVMGLRGMVSRDLMCAVGGGGLAVALIGFADDRRSLSAAPRLAVHFAAALWALVWLGGLPALRVGDHLVSFGWAGYVLGAFGIVWAVNLFNFMDGIDGIAASEAVFVVCAGALLSAAGSAVTDAAGLLAGACAGFLLWNWPPAKIFMGDVGSGYLGYVIAVLALFATRENPAVLWVWLILGGVFFVDATLTLLRRLARGEPGYQAHRTHAYQWLARRWASHAKVTSAVLLVNVLWLLPCATLAVRQPRLATIVTVAAFAPLVLFGLVACGRREAAPRAP